MTLRKCFRLSAFILFALILFYACRQDESPVNETPPQVDDITQVQSSVAGIVVDEKGSPVEGAEIQCGNNTAYTDKYGVFQFINISLSKNNGVVAVKKMGYFKAYRNFITSAGTLNQVRIRLIPQTINKKFASSSGGFVDLPDGAKLTLPANAVTDAFGNPYNGEVNVSMAWINPTDPNLPDIVMGDLRGITTGGEERALETYGMIGVELKDNSGRELKIKSGQTAALTFPIPTALLANSPLDKIDLWHFDETKARWVQEGIATRSGNNYIAQVSHFSFWNCDAPFPLIEFCAKLVDSITGKPLSNVGIRIVRANGNVGFGRTDTAGNVCGKIPRNENLTLVVLNPCNQGSDSLNIGPFNSNTSGLVLKVGTPAVNRIILRGFVNDCSNAPVSKGYVRIYAGNGQVYTANVVNGIYELSIIKCGSESVNYSITALDLNALQQNIPITISANNGQVNIDTIRSCGISSAQFIEIQIDGTPCNLVTPPDNISATDSAISNTSNRCSVRGWKGTNSGTTNAYSTNFNFTHNRDTGRGLTLNSFVVNFGPLLVSEVITSSNPKINLTQYSKTPGSPIEGNFDIMMRFRNSTQTTDTTTLQRRVKCTFRVNKR